MGTDLAAIAKILSELATPPHSRSERIKGDLEGDFHQWFDGGAIRIVTGWSEYHFANGTVAVVPTTPKLRVDIRLPAGRYVSINELESVPPFFPIGAA